MGVDPYELIARGVREGYPAQELEAILSPLDEEVLEPVMPLAGAHRDVPPAGARGERAAHDRSRRRRCRGSSRREERTGARSPTR